MSGTTASYAAFLAESRPAEAALSAVMMGIFRAAVGDEPEAMGWIGRAGRLLKDLPECAAHGYLELMTQVQTNLALGRPGAAVTAARGMQELGERIGDPDVTVLGLHGEGRALLRVGQVADGLALIDEAMVDVMDGPGAPFTQWTLLCFTLEACHEVGDFGRMGHWTRRAEAWLVSRHCPGPSFDAVCAVHRAQLHLLHGAWEEAEHAAMPAARLQSVPVGYAAEAWYVIAEARRLRGAPGASDAYDRAHAGGRNPQPGRALLRLAEGDAEGAARSVRSALAAAGEDRLWRSPLCLAAVETAIAAGRIEEAGAAARELQETASRFGTSGLQAMATSASGAVLLARSLPEEALATLSDGQRRWQAIGAVHESARLRTSLAEAYDLLGDGDSAAAERALDEASYGRLGAPRATLAPDGLTGRECEVLRLVAEGHSNRRIGEVLFISHRTVARHLTNIFLKIEVTSRTQAARYAHDHGLTTPTG
ncbi:response regulator transcription factor [Janibacter cremeus]|uniref:helix-turn-helix transcriptional regulator n=1 Tax=Janibacter cremeus TaxID=1285192 RepID=UPI0023F76EED|nr:helix-turn-helix transcriptional regulator [Janibacter cremeus]WEV79354.1 response regulator transcription factor [Janibacter cremeus]